MTTVPSHMDFLTFNNKLRHPFNLICSAATQGGKSHWIAEMLLKKIIYPEPEKIFYIHAFPSAALETLNCDLNIEFLTAIPDNIAEESFTDKSRPTLIVLDDQLTSISEDVLNLFIRGTHHLNRSCILTVQNVFFQNPSMRTISLNAHYIVLFKQPRDTLQIETLGRQMYPSQSKLFLAAYKQAVERDYGYLLIDLKSTTKDCLRLRTDILGEGYCNWQRVFCIGDSTMEVFVLVPVSEVPGLHIRCTNSDLANAVSSHQDTGNCIIPKAKSKSRCSSKPRSRKKKTKKNSKKPTR